MDQKFAYGQKRFHRVGGLGEQQKNSQGHAALQPHSFPQQTSLLRRRGLPQVPGRHRGRVRQGGLCAPFFNASVFCLYCQWFNTILVYETSLVFLLILCLVECTCFELSSLETPQSLYRSSMLSENMIPRTMHLLTFDDHILFERVCKFLYRVLHSLFSQLLQNP